MKIVKEQIIGENAKKKEGLAKRILAQKAAAKEKKAIEAQREESIIRVYGTQKEYDAITQVGRFGYDKGFAKFIQESLENFEELDELIVPEAGHEKVQPYRKIENFPPAKKEALLNAASKAGLDERDFVRAVLWTSYKKFVERKKEAEAKAKELRLQNQGLRAAVVFPKDQLDLIEKEFGEIRDNQHLSDIVRSIVVNHLDKVGAK